MNSILNIIKENLLLEKFNNIDANIISESLNCSLLQDLAKQLKDIKIAKDDEIEKDYQKNLKELGEQWAYKSSNYNKVFREIFGNYNISWDKITDSNIKHIEPTEEKNRKLEKEINDVIKQKSKSIILVKDKEDKNFLYLIYLSGTVYQLSNNGNTGDRITKSVGRGWKRKDLTNREKLDLCLGKNIYFIDISDAEKEARNLIINRNNQKLGMIMLDPESLKEIAKKNIERYKEIIRRNKANNLDNNDLLNKAKNIINKTSTFAIMIAKDPVRYADLISSVSSLSLWIYDKKKYNYTNNGKSGYYSGVDGLLPLIMKYTELIKDLNGHYNYEYKQKELDEIQKKIEIAVEKAEKIIEEIENKI